jgi:membrane carboxypeptidase/penicillin-binding protein
MKAILDAAQGARLRGASTITQQVTKNFLLSGDRSAERKVKEIILAARLENTLSKEKILELYLNEIFLGQNSYGVTAAAETYFGKPLEDLTVAEVAYLPCLCARCRAVISSPFGPADRLGTISRMKYGGSFPVNSARTSFSAAA